MSQPHPYRAILIDPEAFLDHLERGHALPTFATLLANIVFIYGLVERSGTYTMQTSGGLKISPDTLCKWLEGTAEPDDATRKTLLAGYAADLRPHIAEFRKIGKPLPTFRVAAFTVYRDLPKQPPDLIPAATPETAMSVPAPVASGPSSAHNQLLAIALGNPVVAAQEAASAALESSEAKKVQLPVLNNSKVDLDAIDKI